MASLPPGQDGGYEQQAEAPAAAAAAGKKKRTYAGQAYEFGAGANAALGGQQTAGGQYAAPAGGAGQYGYPAAQQPSYGMPPQPGYDANQPAAGAQGQSGYAAPAYGGQPGGYQPPQPEQQQSYSQGAANMLQQGVQGVTQQFSQMGFGSGQPAQPPPQQQPGLPAQRLNPLMPVDISVQGQPFHVSDLDQPPPPIILPPNVSALLSYDPDANPIIVVCDTLASRELLSKVCEIHTQRHAYHIVAA